MNQDPNFPRFGQQQPQQYGLNTYDTPPKRAGVGQKMLGGGFARKLSNPLFATVALVIAGVAFAGVIITAYPDSEGEANIPVVKAETTAFKQAPGEGIGGISYPSEGTTIFSAIEGQDVPDPAPIENLLEDQDTAEKLAAFARQVEDTIEEDQNRAEQAPTETLEDLTTLAKAETPDVKPSAPLQQDTRVANTSTTPIETVIEKPKIVHKAGENPETLEFVRSVLDQKDGKVASSGGLKAQAADIADAAGTAAAQVAAVSPAAGTPATTFKVLPGQHYVQLASVKSLSGAEGEWGKLQNTFNAELKDAPHRVQAAELGDRGTFFRVQAGPMSKDSAVSICESIKAQKPGGCLVTQ